MSGIDAVSTQLKISGNYCRRNMEIESLEGTGSSEDYDSSNGSTESEDSSIPSARGGRLDLTGHHLEVHWDLSENKILVKFPDGYDQLSKPRFAISYVKPEEMLELVKSFLSQNPLFIDFSGGSDLKNPYLLQFLTRFGKQVKTFTYICALNFPLELTTFVSILTQTMENLEEVDLRQLRVDQSGVVDKEAFLKETDSGTKLRNVKKIIFGEHSELTELLTGVIFRMMPNVEEIWDFPIQPLLQGFLRNEQRLLVGSVSVSERLDFTKVSQLIEGFGGVGTTASEVEEGWESRGGRAGGITTGGFQGQLVPRSLNF
ncbi:unnamed protein product [Allacma fusca]|uniref:Uncharacterized protein n=1 Tax=Allacma fusca TaxID=39272 RepID=A0A8J2LS44_9HEXA|nr:unnamed protein product [Allacma fusca]